LLAAGLGLGVFTIFSCTKEFLDRPPVGAISNSDLANKTGVEGTLIGAYSMLDGSGLDWTVDVYNTSVWNAWIGSVAADEAHKGGGASQQTDRAALEGKTYSPTLNALFHKWKFLYAAVGRANETLRLLALVTDGSISEAEAKQITAEARFLRGVYHYELAKVYYNVPYVDETITPANNNLKVPNTHDPNVIPEVWAKIKEDFQFAIDNLSATNAQVGRANSWAAKAFLAKTHMQIAELDEARALYNDIIANGITTKGEKYDLQPEFGKIFTQATKNGPESVFAVQMSVKEGGGTDGYNGNDGMQWNYPPWIGTQGWGYKPSINLVNTYKTVGGLPMLDDYNDVDVKNNFGIDQSLPYTPETGPLDPRLDWTVGRRGLPYHDWTILTAPPEPAGGPYWGKKWVTFNSDANKENIEGWKMSSGINFPMIRFADVLLMAAECEVEVGSLDKALEYVNRVRARAANPAGFLKTYIDDSSPSTGFTNTPAANYVINQYPAGAFTDKEFARKAVRFERRLEFATEGIRFFDLQRYDRINKKYVSPTSTYMADELNEYMLSEVAKFEHYLPGQTNDVLKGNSFTAGKHEVYAIPQSEIDLSATSEGLMLKQNPGHN
ncbi:MAG: RagB/SusD family nutrient uptake outer membrane protein, partial [Chitinophagaceae bacterium]|nr:RagB/SusD family nutrient uptake outer membrane protein [Chitinophagaceae bacterium]